MIELSTVGVDSRIVRGFAQVSFGGAPMRPDSLKSPPVAVLESTPRKKVPGPVWVRVKLARLRSKAENPIEALQANWVAVAPQAFSRYSTGVNWVSGAAAK